jgi:catechol 2,3-dioxygenase-like lactoylglutathione lyase family enzyme
MGDLSILGTKKLAFVELQADVPDTLAAFYCDVLGMSVTGRGAGFVRVGYVGGDADIVFRQGIAGVHSRADRYWKIGITLPNVDMAVAQLRERGVEVSDPRQFQDIGYMCHLADPAGYQIELLQHDFAGNRPSGAGDEAALLGGGALVGQITLRAEDVASELAIYRDQLGMKLLSVQPVEGFGFTLYFLGFTEEVPPGDGPEDVRNREWLWKRPYTTLELQAVEGPLFDQSGYLGIGVSGFDAVTDAFGHAILIEEG